MRQIDVLKTSELHAVIDRCTHEDTVEEQQLYTALSRLERRQYADVDMLLVADVLALVERLSVNGIVPVESLYEKLGTLRRTRINERTLFDEADDKYQNPNWPPMGAWDDNPAAKHIAQEVHSEDALL